MKTLGLILVLLLTVLVALVSADERKSEPPAPAVACEDALAVSRSYNDVLKHRADLYEVDIARLRAANAALQKRAEQATAAPRPDGNPGAK